MTRTTGPPTLGRLLRGFRDSCDFEYAGMVATARRAPGLRREELALLAGVSVDYLVQLEQGRAARPSAPVVAALPADGGLLGRTGHAGRRSPGPADEPLTGVVRLLG